MTETTVLSLEAARKLFPKGATRFAHIEGVVRLAERIERSCGKFEGTLVTAALYHDIGHADFYKVTGFHAVDGALLAKRHNQPKDVVDAVLYHTGSWSEAKKLRPELMSYYHSECLMMKTSLSRALTYCDLHTGPSGQPFTLEQRLADICQRHAVNKALLTVMDEYKERFKQIDEEWHVLIGKSDL